MVLVEYSDSEAESDSSLAPKKAELKIDDETTPHPRKKLKLADNVEPGKEEKKSHTVKSPPPLPSTFHSLYASSVRTSTTDDPSLHGGRKRQVAHVQGNWPSHVYLEWLPKKLQLLRLNDVMTHVQTLLRGDIKDYLVSPSTSTIATFQSTSSLSSALTLHTFLASPLGAQLPLHISLSAPLVLTIASKSAFQTRLVNAIQSSRLGHVEVILRELDLVPNFEGSRWFLVVRVEDKGRVCGGNSAGDTGEVEPLSKLLSICNRVCRENQLAELYNSSSDIGVDTKSQNRSRRQEEKHSLDLTHSANEERSRFSDDAVNAFHISIGWTLQAPTTELREAIRKIQLDELSREIISFDKVKLKIGNVVDDMML